MSFVLKPNLKLCQNYIKNWTSLTRCIYNSVRNTKSGGILMSEEVRAAIAEEKPVVALESAIITHGMPFPHNLSTATSVEAIIRENGAIPATVAVIHGSILVGIDSRQLQQLAEAKHAIKISTRDYPFAVTKGLTGGTTVAATLYASGRCGIRLMATGGIGGVHLEGEKSMDISADLIELGRTPMAVVSSGIKSILDLDRTLEYMETLGIGLASFDNGQHLPLFFSKQSGRMAPYDVSSSTEAANVLNEWLGLGVPSGLLFAVPVPEHLSIDAGLIKNIIREANDEAKKTELIGKQLTPFLLQHIVTKTAGKSLHTNVGLVKNNAKIAAEIAVKYAGVKRNESGVCSAMPHVINSTRNCLSSPVVVGGSNVDYMVKMESDSIQPGGATNLGKISRTFGGVGRNLAEGLARLGLRPIFISAVGQDSLGKELMASIPHSSPRGWFQSPSGRTATYCVVLKRSGDVHLGVGDMAIHHSITPQHVSMFADDLRRAPLVAIDGNTPIESIEAILDICADNQTAVWYEPTDINRAAKPFLTQRWHSLSYISPNIEELRSIYLAVTKDATINAVKANEKGDELELVIEEAVNMSKPLLEHIHCVVVTMGRHGVLVLRNGDFDNPFPIKYVKGGKCSAVYYPAPKVSITSVSGSGDSLAATMMAGILTGRSPQQCMQAGLQAAAFSLQSRRTIPETLSYNTLFSSAFDNYSSRVISVT